jgi:hypothetical protein
MSTDEVGWVWIRRGQGGWRVGGLHQGRPAMETLSTAEIAQAIGDFRDLVVQAG